MLTNNSWLRETSRLRDANQERLQGLLEGLKTKAESSRIVVEGKRDAHALQSLGVLNLFILNKENKWRSLYEAAEMIAMTHKSALLMFDADKKGRQLSRTFKGYLQMNGVKTDTKIGELILKNARVRHVEELKLAE
ncbi:MAG: hypothetical protein HYT16_02335 [DPANN group archaeon]|nr:hypothetical protein [DPANN group archaeon]